LNSLHALLEKRELLWSLVSQELRVRYRRAALGFLWSLLNPLLTMLILAVVFQFLVRLPVQSYALFLLSAMLPWMMFATSVQRSSTTLILSEHLIRRYPLPKLIFPASAVLVNAINFILSLGALLSIVGPVIGFRPGLPLLILPLSVMVLACVTFGASALIAIGSVYYRDLEHLVGVLLTAWMYATPILYPLELPDRPPIIPEEYHFFFKLNPMYAVIQLFTRPIYWGVWPEPTTIATALGTALVGLAIGLGVFSRREQDLVFHL